MRKSHEGSKESRYGCTQTWLIWLIWFNTSHEGLDLNGGGGGGCNFREGLIFGRPILKMVEMRGGGTFKTQDWSSM